MSEKIRKPKGITFRWNDEKKTFELNKEASADFLNFFHAGVYGYWWARSLIFKERLKERIRHYYSPEPNAEWIIELYDKAIDLKW